jgi:hypothetical protein
MMSEVYPILHFSVCCNYSLFKNFIKLRLDKIVVLVHCFNIGFKDVIKLAQIYKKKSSATRSKYLSQLHYAHSRVLSRGRKKDMTFFLTKCMGLSMGEN